MSDESHDAVLIVNDIEDQLELMSVIIRQSGYRVLAAGSGRDAFDIARRHAPILVISDVIMPDVNGIELCQMIRADGKIGKVPILLVSALRKDTNSIIESLRAGADGYLESPYEPLHLITKVSRMIERYRYEEEIRQLNELLEARVVERTTQLEEANRELQAFSYSVAHELCSPLGVINNLAKLLARGNEERFDVATSERVRLIEQLSGRAEELTQDLLEFAQVGERALSREAVDVGRLFESVIRSLKTTLDKRTVQWDVGDLPTAYGDPSLLLVVIQNLLSNAVKYTRTRDAARIRVRGRRAGGETIYSVRDNGVGFSPECHRQIFGVFQRLHRAEGFEGTGIGLATVQRIVRRHGGRVWAEGLPDQGATFHFALPSQAEVEAEMQATSSHGTRDERAIS